MATNPTGGGARLAPVTPDEAVSGIRSGERVFVGSGAAEPDSLVEALTARAGTLRDVRLVHALTFGPARYVAPEHAQSFRVTTFFIAPNLREAVADGRADFVPVFLHETGRLCQDVDWALVQLSPPDRHGFCSTGISADITVHAVRAARHVVGEINPRMPRTLGDTLVHVDQLAAVTEVDRPLPELPPPPVSPAMRRISEQVAGMIGDGDCLQIGIGGIPNTVLAMIGDRRHLGIHTEMLTDGIVALHRAGAIDGSRKAVMPGRIVCTFAGGTRALYDFVHDNPLVSFRACDFTNDPHVIGQNDNVVAINSALQIDLTGQVDADSIGVHVFSGIGGQVDFIRGASRSRGGRPIIVLPSTAMDGRVTRIVPTLSPGAGVVTSRGDVHHVLTEHGHVNLFGMGVHERARALISIAHPDFREDLERAAHKLRLTWRDRSG
jgi:acyl-CoA hydrolase